MKTISSVHSLRTLLSRIRSTCKDTAVGRKICHDIVLEITMKRRVASADTTSDML